MNKSRKEREREIYDAETQILPSLILFILFCSKLTAQQRALLRAFAETEKDAEGTVKTFDGKCHI